MTNFAMILMASLPTSWKVVGGVLIVVTLVAVVLFVIKAREAGALKKEVEELRDTMRMMRYEEANLSRMLHTVDKHPELMEQINRTLTEVGGETITFLSWSSTESQYGGELAGVIHWNYHPGNTTMLKVFKQDIRPIAKF